MRSPSTSSLNRGFTLIEIMISIAILAVLFGLGLFMSMETFRGTLFRSDSDTAISVLERTRSRAINNVRQSPWGVCYDDVAHSYVTFRGKTYIVGAPGNEPMEGGGEATVSGFPLCSSGGGVVFTQLTGTTSPQTITIVEQARTATISINDEGRINW